jgi:hypothetical protein
MTKKRTETQRDEDVKAETCANQDEEARVKAILEEARQTVKRVAKLELAGERNSRELLNFRLRVAANASVSGSPVSQTDV